MGRAFEVPCNFLAGLTKDPSAGIATSGIPPRLNSKSASLIDAIALAINTRSGSNLIAAKIILRLFDSLVTLKLIGPNELQTGNNLFLSLTKTHN